MTHGPAQALGPGDAVDGFEIVELVAHGTTTTTYRARQRELGRTVLLKLLHADALLERGEREKARREAVRAASLEHPAIVPVLAAGELDDRLYIAMAEVEGATLADAVALGEITPARACELLGPIAAGLDAAHALGVIHGEVRPECVVLDRYGNARLRDFGVTRMSGRTGMATRSEFLETLRYMAPERILNAGVTAAADVYGLAGTAVWCLTGAHPFPDLPVAQLVALRAEAQPPVLEAPGGDDGGVGAVIAAGMALDPGARPASATEFAERLRSAVGRLPESVRATPRSLRIVGGEAPAPAARRRPAPAAPPVPAGATRIDRVREYVPPPAPEPDSGPGWGTIAACAGIALAVGIAAFGIARQTAPQAPDPPAAGPFELAVGEAWRPQQPDPALRPGLEDPVGLVTTAGRGTAAVGIAAAGPPGDPLGLPGGATLVDAGPRKLLRYERDGGVITFALPTERGTLVANCSADTGEDRCAALLVGARGAAVLAPEPPPAATDAVSRVTQAVETARGNAVGLSGDRLERAEAANALAGAYREAAPDLDVEGVDAGTAKQLTELREALEAGATAYEDLATAVDRERAAGYRAARRAAAAADRRFAQLVKGLRRSGYKVA